MSIPDFLRATLVLAHNHFCGEWDLVLGDAMAVGASARSGEVLAWCIACFAQSFPWVAFASAETTEGQWDPTNGPLDAWIHQHVGPGGLVDGLEAALDLTLDWVAPDGTQGNATMPRSGRLIVTNIIEDRPACWLTIWPNLFTNEIWLVLEHEQDAVLTSFKPAAAANRRRLRESLLQWELVTGGTIVNWETERLEHGIDRYGIAEDAVAYR